MAKAPAVFSLVSLAFIGKLLQDARWGFSMSLNLDLKGRTALVTGAGRGIGRACAIALAEAGAEVWLAARTRDEIEAAAAEIRGAGGKAHAVPVDVTRSAELRKAI